MTAVDPSVWIRRAEPADASTVRALVRELAVQQGRLDELAATEERWGEVLADDGVTVLVALVDGTAVGYVSAVRTVHLWSGRDVMTVDDLYVAPGARGRGIAALLMTSLADRAPNRPIRWEVDEGNLRAQRFHLGLGAHLRRRVTAWWEPSGAHAPGG